MDGRGVREARARLGLGQAELARELGVTPVTVWRWEHGRTRVPRWVEASLRRIEGTEGGVAKDEVEHQKEGGASGPARDDNSQEEGNPGLVDAALHLVFSKMHGRVPRSAEEFRRFKEELGN